jgi:dihydroneopterin aldolase
MKKEELVAQLEAAKVLSSQVDIDKVIVLINQIESGTKTGLTQELAEEIADRIERTLDYNASDLVDKDDVTFSISYGNVIEIDDASINVSETMDHITACLIEFVIEEDDEAGSEQGEETAE